MVTAVGMLRELPERQRRSGHPLQLGPAADPVEALIATGELGHARMELAQLEELAARTSRWARIGAGRACGMLAAADGDYARAFEAFERALREDEPGAYPVERGRTPLALGVAQRRALHRRAARRSLSKPWGSSRRSAHRRGPPRHAMRSNASAAANADPTNSPRPSGESPRSLPRVGTTRRSRPCSSSVCAPWRRTSRACTADTACARAPNWRDGPRRRRRSEAHANCPPALGRRSRKALLAAKRLDRPDKTRRDATAAAARAGAPRRRRRGTSA